MFDLIMSMTWCDVFLFIHFLTTWPSNSDMIPCFHLPPLVQPEHFENFESWQNAEIKKKKTFLMNSLFIYHANEFSSI